MNDIIKTWGGLTMNYEPFYFFALTLASIGFVGFITCYLISKFLLEKYLAPRLSTIISEDFFKYDSNQLYEILEYMKKEKKIDISDYNKDNSTILLKTIAQWDDLNYMIESEYKEYLNMFTIIHSFLDFARIWTFRLFTCSFTISFGIRVGLEMLTFKQ